MTLGVWVLAECYSQALDGRRHPANVLTWSGLRDGKLLRELGDATYLFLERNLKHPDVGEGGARVRGLHGARRFDRTTPRHQPYAEQRPAHRGDGDLCHVSPCLKGGVLSSVNRHWARPTRVQIPV